MEKKKNLRFYMRSLHRDLGFFAIGLVMIYALSGIVLVFRDVSFMKTETAIEKVLPKGLDEQQLGAAMQSRNFKVSAIEGDIMKFQGGTYNSVTGEAKYVTSEYRAPFKQMIRLHKLSSKGNATHWVSVLFGIVLAFLALSSFWMFKPGTKPFSRGMVMVALGIAITAALLLFC